MIKLIAAVAEGGVIGCEGRIPWDLPEDRRMFRELTMGGTLIMGRRTFESIGGPLPGREIIVVTSQGREILKDITGLPELRGSVLAAKDLKQALRMAGDQEAFLCGGERIYAEGLRLAEVLYITRVEMPVEGDAFFPKDYEDGFKLVGRERLSANCTLLTYVRNSDRIA